MNYDRGVDSEYWVDGSDGSIIFIWAPPPYKENGPMEPPPSDDTSAIDNTFPYAIIAALVFTLVATVAVSVFKRNKQTEQRSQLHQPSQK